MRSTGDGAAGTGRPSDHGLAGRSGIDRAPGIRPDVSGFGRGTLRPGLARLGFLVPAPGSADKGPGVVSRGRGDPSGTGRPDGDTVGTPCRIGGDVLFGFDRDVPSGGYAWWYLDAISGDGRNALTVIAFVGSVFSPYYAAARRRGQADPLHHVGVNAILYTPHGKYWTLTERGRSALTRTPDRLGIGPSAWTWTGDRLVVDIAEWTVPIPKRLRGRITVDPGPLFHSSFELHENGRHQWQPIAPCAAVEVDFEQPNLAWQGKAYVDMNAGAEPLEAGFKHWNWSRRDGGETTRIHYDVMPRSGKRRELALECRRDGTCTHFAAEPISPLPRTGWRVARASHSLDGLEARIGRTLEDTPFYSRSMLAFDGEGPDCHTIHESVDLDRFRSRWVQVLLPFKMPRLASWTPASSASSARRSAMATGRSS
jgi:carotenoid 1,2-hydratase